MPEAKSSKYPPIVQKDKPKLKGDKDEYHRIIADLEHR